MSTSIYLKSLLLLILTFSISKIFAQSDSLLVDNLELQTKLKHLDDDLNTRPFTVTEKVIEELKYAEANEWGQCIVIAHTILGKGYEKQRNYEKALVHIYTADSLSKVYDYHKYDFLIKFRKGMIHCTRGENEIALPLLLESLEIAKELDNYKALGSSNLFLGYINNMLGNYDDAADYTKKAFEVYEKNNDKARLAKCHLYMGMLYNRMGEPDKGLEETQIALRIAKEQKDTAQIIPVLQNLMSSYAIRGNVKEAFKYYNERADFIDQIEFPENRKLDLNIGILYIQDEQYQKGLDILKICRDYYGDEGNLYRISLIDHWIAIAYRGLNQYDMSAEKSLKSFNEAIEANHPRQAEISAYTLFQTYHWRGKNDLAIEWLQKSNEIKDSLLNSESEKSLLALQTKFDTYKKEQEIELLKSKREIDRNKRNLLWIALILGSLLALALLYAQKQRAKRDKIHQQNLLFKSESEKEILQQKLEFKQKELTTQIITMTQKNTVLQNVRDRIQDLKTAGNENQVSRLIRNINQGINNSEEWDKFLATFKSIHSSFLTKLNQLSGSLTSNEIRLASLMKMNLSSKEIASILNISDDGVKKARYRLRKKLNVDSEILIQDYLMGL